MNCKKTNKNIITAMLTLALVLVCAASVVSCNKESEDTLYPEYTGDIWTVVPSDDLSVETGHVEAETNDNIIDADYFTTPVSEDAAVSDGVSEDVTDSQNDATDGESVTTTVHVIDSYDGIHFWPSDEFDESGYHTLTPVD